jgi:signal transduction histidine kinase/ActR/RegA family two-component response regulator
MDTISPANARPSLRVLLIEDSASDAELLSLELLGQGYAASLRRVESPQSLVQALEQETWDVVLSEDRVPGIDALSALSIVQSRGVEVPFIIVSESIAEQCAIDIMRAGAHDFLFKHSLRRLGAVIERETREAELRAERRRMQQQLLLADRLTSLGTLAAGVAHEINNPLAYVAGNLEFALHRLRAGTLAEESELQEVVQALGQAQEGAARIGHITRDLKVFCRSGADDTNGVVNVRRVMESSISIAWNQIRHRAKLVRNFERVRSVSGNENRLGQVFLNLLVNAAQALPDDLAQDNEITVSIRSEGNDAVIEVRDTGSGMTPEHRARIFEPFFTTKAPGVGSGIGLSICRSIVGEMAGVITCESNPGQGTTFRISLPQQEVAALASIRPPVDVPPLPRSRVLVIDDEPALCGVVRRLLRNEHDVVGYVDAREALAALARDDGYDVIICDIMMPYMSGNDFFNALRSRHPELSRRVVFMTGGAFNAPAQQFLRTTSNPILEKPFETIALHVAIAQALEAGTVSGSWLTARIEQAV